jgi:hypothetical protein
VDGGFCELPNCSKVVSSLLTDGGIAIVDGVSLLNDSFVALADLDD